MRFSLGSTIGGHHLEYKFSNTVTLALIDLSWQLDSSSRFRVKRSSKSRRGVEHVLALSLPDLVDEISFGKPQNRGSTHTDHDFVVDKSLVATELVTIDSLVWLVGVMIAVERGLVPSGNVTGVLTSKCVPFVGILCGTVVVPLAVALLLFMLLLMLLVDTWPHESEFLSFEMVSDKLLVFAVVEVVAEADEVVAGNVWNGVIVTVVRANDETHRSRRFGSGFNFSGDDLTGDEVEFDLIGDGARLKDNVFSLGLSINLKKGGHHLSRTLDFDATIKLRYHGIF